MSKNASRKTQQTKPKGVGCTALVRPTDGFRVTFTAPDESDWVRRCMESVRAHLEEYCFVNPPLSDIEITVGRTFGPRRGKRTNDEMRDAKGETKP